MTRLPLFGSALVVALAAAAPAAAQHIDVAPYIELDQILTADLDSGDVLTYSQVAAGVDAAVSGRTTEAQLSYRYERHIAWDDDVGDDDVHQGLARAAVTLAPGVAIEGGALATRARSQIGGAAPGSFVGNVDNITQVYAAYVGPTVTARSGPVAVSATYRYGYTKVEAPGFTAVPAGEPRRDYYDDSNSHAVGVTVGTAPGDVLPVGVTVSAAYEREDAGQLDQRFEDGYVRGDVLAPVSRTVALAGGVGYEKIKISQRDALTGADDAPVVDADGRYRTDPASPRRIAYRTDGLYWDAGVVWRPSPRTEIQGHVGRRYDSWTYYGSASYAASETVGMRLAVYDEVDTFARQLRNGLSGLPTSFIAIRDQLGQHYNGCTFGTSGSAVGGCLNSVFQSIETASLRARGVDGVIYAARGPTRLGVGAGYANRHLFAPDQAPGTVVTGLDDESYYAQFFADRALDDRSSVQGNLFANYYVPGYPGSSDIFSTGATGSYNRTFGHLDATASLGVYAFDQEQGDDTVSAQALLGMRYQF